MIRRSLSLFLLAAFAAVCHAAPVVYDIDFSDTFDQFPSGFQYDLSVTGTLTVDADLPVSSAILGSNLLVEAVGPGASGWPIALNPIPTFSQDADGALDWVDIGGELFLQSTMANTDRLEQGNIRFDLPIGLNNGGWILYGDFVGGSYDIYSRLFVVDRNAGAITIDERLPSPAPGAAKIGMRSVAIPEPASAFFLMCAGFVVAIRRRRRVILLPDRHAG